MRSLRAMSPSDTTPAILALDTATNLCSVALVNDSEIKEIQRDLPRAHNQHILSMIDELLEGRSLSSAVSMIACGVGPGSFTGIRVAVGVAQGLGWSLDLPVYPFCSLEAQARSVPAKVGDRILSTIDAQIGQVYWSWSERVPGGIRLLTEPTISTVKDIRSPMGDALADWVADDVVIAGDASDAVVQCHAVFAHSGSDSAARPRPSQCALSYIDNPAPEQLITAQALEPRYVQQDIGWKKLSEQGNKH
jgi:tRNA threonylcarbamoyladenosine biosynthesis protein TsaB